MGPLGPNGPWALMGPLGPVPFMKYQVGSRKTQILTWAYILDIYDIYILGIVRSSTQNFIYLTGLFSIFGSIVGTFFIPLDVNELWQEWPITVFVGCICGYLLGFLLWCLKCGKKIIKK